MKDIDYYARRARQGWMLRRDMYCPEDETNQETLYTLSNGYIGVRGALGQAELHKDAATFIAGMFDKSEEENPSVGSRGYVKNKAITPAYATVPDCNLWDISSDGIGFDFINSKIHSFEQALDMERGIFSGE